MKDHVTSLHRTTDVFKISCNNASALLSLIKERFEDEQDREKWAQAFRDSIEACDSIS